MGVKARGYVERYFNRAEQAKQFADLLEHVASLKGQNGPERKRFRIEPAS